MSLELKGLSHGLKKCPPDCCIGMFESLPARRAKEIRGIPARVSLLFLWYTGRDSNPQPSEPESDALSIEPPVHLLESLAIIPIFSPFVKGAFLKIFSGF